MIKLIQGALYHRLDLNIVRHIHGECQRLPSQGADQLRRFLNGGKAPARAGHVRPFAGEGERQFAPNPAASAGDQSCCSLQIKTAGLPVVSRLFFCFRILWLHEGRDCLAGDAGHVIAKHGSRQL